MNCDNNISVEEFVSQAFAALGALFSGSIVLTGFVFPKMMLNPKHRIFSHIIFCISLSDFIVDIAFSFGYPIDVSKTKCKSQSFLTLMFSASSWLWTVLLIFQLRCVMVKRCVWLQSTWMHLIAWGGGLIVALLPLSNPRLSYGQDDGIYKGKTPCILRSGQNFVLFGEWLLGDFVSVALICFLIMVVCVVDVLLRFRLLEGKRATDALSLSQQMRWYPIAMLFCWLPLLLYLTHGVIFTAQCPLVENIFQILASQYGTAMAIIFHTQTSEARYKWGRLIGCTQWTRDQTETSSDGNPEAVFSSSSVSPRASSLGMGSPNGSDIGSGIGSGIGSSNTLGSNGENRLFTSMASLEGNWLLSKEEDEEKKEHLIAFALRDSLVAMGMPSQLNSPFTASSATTATPVSQVPATTMTPLGHRTSA